MINVSKPFLPPKEEYDAILKTIWDNNWLTNRGPLVNQLESRLKEELNLKNFLFVSNGTIAIQIAIKALGITKEVITTPFSYVATTSSILWENCTAKFCDINKDSLNIDPNLIEDLITDDTEAILATHVFGNPCDIDALSKICSKYSLKLIFDAAHCFNTLYKEQSVLSYGDISTVSFHATKLFHTVEGGGIVANAKELHENVYLHHNFGHTSPTTFKLCGINGKNSEFHAAIGLVNLNHKEEICDRRKKQWNYYYNLLKDIPNLSFQSINPDAEYNYSYYPIILDSEKELEGILNILNNHYVYPRRYFYPSLNKIEYINSNVTCPVSEKTASTILCLPLFHELKNSDQDLIISLIKRYFRC